MPMCLATLAGKLLLGSKNWTLYNGFFPLSVHNHINLLILLIHLILDEASYIEYLVRYSSFNFDNYFLINFGSTNFPEIDNRQKSETFAAFKQFKSWAENVTS